MINGQRTKQAELERSIKGFLHQEEQPLTVSLGS